MTAAGIVTVARQEFRVRLRAGRWKLLLVAWLVLLVLFTALAGAAAGQLEGLEDDGVIVFGALTLFVLGLSLLVVPSLAAQSVNGDRERGTLAPLQVTRLTPWEITLGKFAAAWGTGLVFLLLTLPVVLFTLTQGGVTLGRVVTVGVIVALLLGVVCALSLMLSALLSRTTTSGVLSYLVVAALTLGTGIAFGLGSVASQERFTETYANVTCTPETAYEQLYDENGPRPRSDGSYAEADLPDGCTQFQDSYETSRTRTDRIWWLLAPNPFVIVADAAPALPQLDPRLTGRDQENARQARDADVLGQLGNGVRELRRGPTARGSAVYVEADEGDRGAAVWPYGLAFDLLLAGAALAVTARRLRAPSKNLPKGQRVA